MPNCKNCGAEVDLDQKTCAWCGTENPAGGGAPPQRLKPAPIPAPPPPRPQAPSAASTGSEMRIHKGSGPSIEDARKLAQIGDMTGALSLFNRILETQPSHTEALFGLGGVYFKQGEHRKAIEQWLKLKVIDPNYPNLENWIGQAKQKLPPSPPRKPASSLDVSTEAPAPDEDWRRQSVKISEEEQERALAAAARPQPRVEAEPEPPEAILEEDDGVVRAKPWVIPVGWGMIVVYVGLIWLLYFSSLVRG